ncbi:phosphate ABC transporter permease subunit PstC [Methanoregula sp.]|uniref:phosphate ABC transporter permease subunit PstC n=1 Tax=Methanoregula sp. TaxID=2052170 RepID=UPI003BAE555E
MNGKPDIHKILFLSCSIATALSVIIIIGYILFAAAPVLGHEGLGFIFGSTWDYPSHQFGIRPFIIATLMLTIVTVAIACPLGLATAIFLSEWAPPWLDQIMSTMIELLVGVPSVVYGIFGFFILRSYFADFINPFIGKTLGVIPLFQYENDNGLGIPLAATVLALMILPTVVALAREAMRGVPVELREGSTALGATKWETIRHLVIPASLSGIITGLILGTMRAMGETMAVVMLVGNIGITPKSFLDVGEPMTAKILLDIGYYVVEPEGRSALFAIGAVLMIIEIGFVVVIHIISNRLKKRMEGVT